jgi:hypothetical protein
VGAFAKHRDYAIAQCCAGDAEMNASEADRGEDQGEHLCSPFRFNVSLSAAYSPCVAFAVSSPLQTSFGIPLRRGPASSSPAAET